MIIFKQKGDFNNTEKFLKKAARTNYLHILNEYGRRGVAALASATPVDTGMTASSWDYKISITKSSYRINWTNSHVEDGVPIAIIIQYGHATRNGGYVEGRDFINPAMKPIFDDLAKELWREVTGS